MKYIFYILVFAAITLVLLGVFSFFFSPTQGHINSFAQTTKVGSGYPVTRYGLSQSGSQWNSVNVTYSYNVNEKDYENSVYGFFLIDEPDSTYISGQETTVYYFPLIPSISVLKRGLDRWVLLILFSLITLYFFMKDQLGKKRKNV